MSKKFGLSDREFSDRVQRLLDKIKRLQRARKAANARHTKEATERAWNNMNKTPYEIELEKNLFKAWADTVLADFRRKEAFNALVELNNKVHSGYDFNADPDAMTKRVGGIIADQSGLKN